MSKFEDEARGRGVPEDWVAFFGRLWAFLEEGDHGPFELQPPPGSDQTRSMLLDQDDVRVLLSKAEEGVLAGRRADEAINKALVSAARSEERLRETLRLQGTLQERLEEQRRAVVERACAATCERCRKYGPAVWEGDDQIQPDHPDFDPESAQWWHRDTAGEGEGWCRAQSIRSEFHDPCRRPGEDCACRPCREAEERLQQQGPGGPGSCRECGGYNIRWDLQAWRVECRGCGNAGDLPREIPARGVDKS